MAENIVQSLFGFTPQAVQEQMYQAGENRAMRLAQMSRSPTAAAEFYGLRAAERVGAAPIFGPSQQVQRAGNLQSIIQGVQASGVDLSQPEGLIELANAVGQNPEFGGIATSLRQEAAKMTQSQTKFAYDIASKGAQIQKDIAAAGREREPGKVGVTADTGEIVYQQGGQQFVIRGGQRVPFQGSVRQEGGVSVKLDVKGQENVLKIDEEDAKGYRLARESATKALPVLGKMEKLMNEGIVQGSLVDARTGFLKALDTFGLSTSEARKVLGNTEQFNIQVRNLLQSIIKQFGYNPSNADVRFALESLPNASNSPDGLRQILDSLIKANKDQLNESTRALDYYRQNKGSFAGFQPRLDVVSPTTGMKTPSQMTVEELRAEINRKKASGE